LRARFERIFARETGFVTLDRLLTRLRANKRELLMVLDRPTSKARRRGRLSFNRTSLRTTVTHRNSALLDS